MHGNEIHTTETNESDILATVLAPLFASSAAFIEDCRSNNSSLTRGKAFDTFADLYYRAAEFVAHGDRRLFSSDGVLLFGDENGTRSVFVEVSWTVLAIGCSTTSMDPYRYRRCPRRLASSVDFPVRVFLGVSFERINLAKIL